MSSSVLTKPHSRWMLWLPLLVISAWLAWEKPGVVPMDEVVVQSRTPVGEIEISARAVKLTTVATTDGRMARLALIPRNELYPPEIRAPGHDLFAAVDWTPPPPPMVITPPSPIAPPLPFTFIGKSWINEKWQVFLAQGDEVLIVQEGLTLANQYRIDSVAPPLMSLTYLPLGQTQTLAIGESQ